MSNNEISRRLFLKAAMASPLAAPAVLRASEFGGSGVIRDNILLILTSRQSINTISGMGCRYVRTPNIDRLIKEGIFYTESYCTSPASGPARSSIFTGAMPGEAGVIKNGQGISKGIANLGQWLRDNGGYDTVYCGSWHLPGSWQSRIDGFNVIPCGLAQGALGDMAVSRACQSYLLSRDINKSFFLTASFSQPDDICGWVRMNRALMPDVPGVVSEEQLPPLPRNFEPAVQEPKRLAWLRQNQVITDGGYNSINWKPRQWRYYLWNYFRMIEQVDAEIGRVLDALESSGCSDNTAVIFTSDYGEAMGSHSLTGSGCFYEEAVKVPLVIRYPGKIPENRRNGTSLVCGADVLATVCHTAGLDLPRTNRSMSLIDIAVGDKAGHDYIASQIGGDDGDWMLRTSRFKYVAYHGDDVEQLFDIENSPLETVNLAKDSAFAAILAEHRSLLERHKKNLLAK